MLDVAFRVTNRSRIDFAKNGDGDFYLDNRSVYAVFCTLFAHRGEYAHDGDVGTFLFRLQKDGRTTGTRLMSAAKDAAEQCQRDELVRSPVPSVERLRTGAWSIAIEWQTPSGTRQREAITV